MTHTLTIHEMPYTVEDDGAGGSMAVNQQDEPDTTTVDIGACMDDDTLASLTAAMLRDEGLTQDNGDWFSDPDPDATLNYRTGEYTERTATLDGFTPDELAAVSDALAS